MRYKVLLFFSILPVLLVHAQPVQFETTLKSAFEKAKLENKPVFIEYFNSYCPICMKLEPLFSDSALGDFYNTHFVNYKLNTEGEKKEDSLFILKTGLNFTGVPIFLFFDANENFLHYADTKAEVDFLINIGKVALDPVERAAGLEKKYKNGDRRIKTLYAYSLLVQLYNNDSLTTILADELFKSFPKSDLGNKNSYVITKNCVKSIDNGFFKFWIQNMDKLVGFETEKHQGEEKQRLGEIVRTSILSKAKGNWNLEKIAEVKGYILLTELSKNPDAFFWEQETELLAGQKRYDEALLIGKKILEDEKPGIKASLGIIRHFLLIFNTVSQLDTVKKWLDENELKTKDISDEADIMYLNALYYKKTNQTELARRTVDSAFVFYGKNKLETKLLTDLINTK